MLHIDCDGENFYLYAMELFSEAGHVFTSVPEFANHSSEQFAYFDNNSNISFTIEQRAMLKCFNNVSRLFSVNGCTFFSVNLLTTKNERSQAAHDIHTMFHSMIDSDGTVYLFRYDDEVMLSFIGYGFRCILSDWYLMETDYDYLLELLDIANMSIKQGRDYFADMVYSLARSYYLYSQFSTYEILPIDFIHNAGIDGIDKDELKKYIEYELAAPQRKYGNDYVEYDKSPIINQEDIKMALDLMILDITDDDNDNPFDIEIESESEELDKNEYDDESDEETDQTQYEFNDVDQDIFLDPILMVKWLKKNEHFYKC